jgi:hypothetical protein
VMLPALNVYAMDLAAMVQQALRMWIRIGLKEVPEDC